MALRALLLLVLVLLPITAHAAPVVIAAIGASASYVASTYFYASVATAAFIGAVAAGAASAIYPPGPGKYRTECPTFEEPPSQS